MCIRDHQVPRTMVQLTRASLKRRFRVLPLSTDNGFWDHDSIVTVTGRLSAGHDNHLILSAGDYRGSRKLCAFQCPPPKQCGMGKCSFETFNIGTGLCTDTRSLNSHQTLIAMMYSIEAFHITHKVHPQLPRLILAEA